MSSIIRNRNTFHGISVFGRGVFTDDKWGGRTYAGQFQDGHACGLGVFTWSRGSKEYAEHGPDGKYDGRHLARWSDGHTNYRLFERGEEKDSAIVSADGRLCTFNRVACAPDDPRVLALIAHVVPVEVRREARATQLPSLHNSPPSDRPMDRPARFAPAGVGGRHGHRGAHPRRTPSLVVARHSPTAAALQSTSTQRRVHGLFCGTGLTGGAYPLAP
jgi:hypothetical protein